MGEQIQSRALGGIRTPRMFCQSQLLHLYIDSCTVVIHDATCSCAASEYPPFVECSCFRYPLSACFRVMTKNSLSVGSFSSEMSVEIESPSKAKHPMSLTTLCAYTIAEPWLVMRCCTRPAGWSCSGITSSVPLSLELGMRREYNHLIGLERKAAFRKRMTADAAET